MNDLKPFRHGDEGAGSTHAVCNKHNIGGKSVCCECSGKTDCSDKPIRQPAPTDEPSIEDSVLQGRFKAYNTTPPEVGYEHATPEQRLQIVKEVAREANAAQRKVMTTPPEKKCEWCKDGSCSWCSRPPEKVEPAEWEQEFEYQWNTAKLSWNGHIENPVSLKRVKDFIRQLAQKEYERGMRDEAKGCVEHCQKEYERGQQSGRDEERAGILKLVNEIKNNSNDDMPRQWFDALYCVRDSVAARTAPQAEQCPKCYGTGRYGANGAEVCPDCAPQAEKEGGGKV